MAKITKSGDNIYSQMLDAADLVITDVKATGNNKGAVNNMIGLEGYSDPAAAGRDALETTTKEKMRVKLGSIIGMENLTDAQLEAGAMIAMASGNASAYAQVANNDQFGVLGLESAEAPMSTAGMDTGYPQIGLEYFNDAVLDQHMGCSLIFNVQAARQDEFCEGFFRTIAIDPSECGLMVEIQKTMVHRGVRHAAHVKDSLPYNRRNILDAASDYTVLEDASVKFIPYNLEDGTNATQFLPETQYEPKEVAVGSYFIRTSPLAVTGKPKNLLQLSAHPGLVSSGILDESDEFDGRFALNELFVRIRKPGQPAGTGRLVRFNTLNLARASFNKSQEGDGRGMSLEFTGNTFILDQHTLDTTKQPIEALQEVAAGKWTVKIELGVYATVNLQTGKETFVPTVTGVLAVVDENGDVRSVEDAAVAQVLSTFEFEVGGYNYAATRSNSNRRSKGLLIDNVTERERYKIQLGSPLTSRKPVGRTDNATALNDLVVTARMRNNNQAITKLLAYTEQLDEVVKSITNPYDIATIEGVGRHYIRPWCKIENYDVQKQVAALQTSDQPDQLRSGLLTQLRNQVARAYRESRFQPALEMLSGYTISKPEVIIGTDVETANWLWEKGDLRTLGDQFVYRLVTTNDTRFVGRIQWAFIVGKEGFSPLNFANMLWVPELITDTNMIRQDAIANELTVQPRTYHLVNCPVTGVVNAVGLHEFVRGRATIGVQQIAALDTVVTDTDLDGIG